MLIWLRMQSPLAENFSYVCRLYLLCFWQLVVAISIQSLISSHGLVVVGHNDCRSEGLGSCPVLFSSAYFPLERIVHDF